MGRLAKVVQGQSQPGLKAYKKGGPVAPCSCGKKGCMKCGGAVKKGKK